MLSFSFAKQNDIIPFPTNLRLEDLCPYYKHKYPKDRTAYKPTQTHPCYLLIGKSHVKL